MDENGKINIHMNSIFHVMGGSLNELINFMGAQSPLRWCCSRTRQKIIAEKHYFIRFWCSDRLLTCKLLESLMLQHKFCQRDNKNVGKLNSFDHFQTSADLLIN